MKSFHRKFRLVLILVLMNVVSPICAQEQRPHEYMLGDIQMVIEHSLFAYSTKLYNSTTVKGDGSVLLLHRDGEQESSIEFMLPIEEVKEILRRIYKIRFFELEEWYMGESHLEFGGEGLVNERGRISNHQHQTQITIEIGDYKKSVQFGDKAYAPSELIGFPKYFEEVLKKYMPDSGTL